MLTEKWMGVAPGIVLRLRIVFVVIAMIVVVAGAVSVDKIDGLQTSVRNLTVSSVAVFVKAEETERSLKSLTIILQQINGATTADELMRLGREMAMTLSQLQTQMAELSDIQQTDDLAAERGQSMRRIEENANLILAANSEVLEHETTLNLIELDLRATRDTIRHILEEETFVGANRAPAGDLNSADDVTLSQVEQRYSQQLLRASAITSITLETDAIMDKASHLRNLTDVNELNRIESLIRFKLRSITTLLSQIESQDARMELAQGFIHVRDQIVGENGAVPMSERLLLHQTALNDYVANQLSEIEGISTFSSQLTVNARSAIDLDNADVARKARQTTWVLGMAVVSILLVIGVTTLVVVERQINRRMSKLTHGVLALAGGKTDVDVDVAGSDEIGKIAYSLEVFRSNAKELVRSNVELERFASVAAHDLRSPLRAIQDLIDWIAQDEETAFSDESTEMFALLENRVERLNNLLTDLLVYSRVGSEADALESVAVRDVVQEIADMLDPQETFDVTYLGDVDTITIVATPFYQTLRNLVNNSMKHHDRESGKIEVSARIQNGRIHCTVSDDGPGIDPKYHDKIFGLFQTLRPRDEIEGSGLGLAIIRKVVERYGGAITVASDPNSARGSIFRLDFPIDVQK